MGMWQKGRKDLNKEKENLMDFTGRKLHIYYRKENEKLEFDTLITVIISNSQL